MKNTPYFEPKPPERRYDLELVELKNLFNPLANKYGKEPLLKYIKDKTEIYPIVVSQWLDNFRIPSPSICRAVINCLRNFQPTDLPPVQLIIPDKEPIPEPPVDGEIKPTKPRPKKSATPNEWEADGKYLNLAGQPLTIYESELIDYLKKNFQDKEFTIPQIKFEEKRIKGRKFMHQHLSALIASDYVIRPEIRDNKYYYKLTNK